MPKKAFTNFDKTTIAKTRIARTDRLRIQICLAVKTSYLPAITRGSTREESKTLFLRVGVTESLLGPRQVPCRCSAAA